MTREEAIDVLSDFRKFTLSILGKSIYADRCSAIDMAIEALQADTDMSEYCDRLWKIAYERGKTKAEQYNKDAIAILEDIIETYRNDEEYKDWVEACAYAINLLKVNVK